MEKLPSSGDIVVCRISKVLDYGVFVELLEFSGVTGFVHISQVSSSWVKNIRNFVKENQVRAAQVTNVDVSKNQLDLSFTRVSAEKQRIKIEEFKQSKRSQKLIELLAKQNSLAFDVAWAEVAVPLLEKYETLYDAFSELLLDKEAVLSLVPKKWQKSLEELVGKNIEAPRKQVKGVPSLSSPAPNGVELVKGALLSAKKAAKSADVEIFYAGGGKYMVKVTSFDYKVADKVLRQTSEAAIESIENADGKGSFEKLD